MIIQHECQQRHPSSSMETNPFINVIFGKGRGHPQQGGTKPTRICEFYGRLGHTIDLCFQKNNINPTKCTHCDRVVHSSDVCYTKFGYPPGHPKYPRKPCPFNNRNTFGNSGATAGGNVNNVTASSYLDVAPTLIHEGERKDVSTLGQGLHITTAQFQQLMSLLNKASRSGGGNSEIPSRANLSHSNPNQSHNSSLGNRYHYCIFAIAYKFQEDASWFRETPDQSPMAHRFVTDERFCHPHRLSIQINTESGIAYNQNNNDRLFYIRNTSLSPHNRRVLYEDNRNPIVSFYSKIMRPQGRCKVFRGARRDPTQFLFSVKKVNRSNTPSDTTMLNVFRAENIEERRNDFTVVIFGNRNSCTVYAGESISDDAIVAQMTNTGFFIVDVNPNIDYAFIVALIMIVKDIRCSTESITDIAFRALQRVEDWWSTFFVHSGCFVSRSRRLPVEEKTTYIT
ncbi:hypothetical protein V8G54_018507 [Vigna mungo]|uniref:Uncharacterized protein n=1 Tax=Vigna mungo TaxID=3915 RepID=A0AAQ3RUS7_VIGMU